MKKVISLFYLLGFVLGVNAQKYDYMWLVGMNITSHDSTNLKYSLTQLDFNLPPLLIYRRYRPLDMMAASASIADKYGVIQFYTDGYFINNRNDQRMPNGDSLNPGQVAIDYFTGSSYPAIHGSMILPKPGNDSVYYMIHNGWEYGSGALLVYCNKLYYSIIDTRLNNGLGDVIEKNKLIKEGVFDGGSGMAACKHANGRDWWIIMQEYHTNCFYEYLLTPYGIDTMGKQCIGDTIHCDLGRGSNLFSPDGNKYIWSNPYENLSILDFDRCTGIFSNFLRIRAADSLGIIEDGVAVSPNSRYLYLASGTDLRQFDLEAANVEQSEIIIDNTWQGTPQTSTLYCQLAPDGKIYINPERCDTFLHVINMPDSPSVQCNFVRNQITLPTYNCYYLPYYPNYRLGRLIGSDCDTVYSDIKPLYIEQPWLKVFPNPSTDEVQFDYNWIEWEKMEDLKLKIEDLSGRVVMEQQIPKYSTKQNFSVKQLAAGVYTVQLQAVLTADNGRQTTGNNLQQIAVCKLVKQ